MRTVCAILAALSVTCAGCAAVQSPPAAPESFEHTVSSSHVELDWTCSQPASGLLQVDGIALNRWQVQEIRFLEFELVGVNDRERTVSEARADLPAIQLRMNDPSPFRLQLRAAGTEVRYDLYYQYRFTEGSIMSALESAPVQLFAQQLQRFMVRDACGPSQHRRR
ncbi:MAG TPA: hypothetical protein VMG58_13820 [Candidatus Sulfotelmatobacter sp.]|nr:hypothetical protein [Candidatus Sulfotelmatobacter sp.]